MYPTPLKPTPSRHQVSYQGFSQNPPTLSRPQPSDQHFSPRNTGETAYQPPSPF